MFLSGLSPTHNESGKERIAQLRSYASSKIKEYVETSCPQREPPRVNDESKLAFPPWKEIGSHWIFHCDIPGLIPTSGSINFAISQSISILFTMDPCLDTPFSIAFALGDSLSNSFL